MSVFETKENTNSEVSETTEEKQTNTKGSWLSKVVESKGDQWSDPEVLAKGKIDADDYINKLKAEKRELEEALTKQDYAKSILEKLEKKQEADAITARPPTNDDGNEEETNTNVSENDLENLVNKLMAERETQSSVKQNLDVANSKLVDKYGSNAESVVNDAAKSLGVTSEDLKDIASKSPVAFLKLVGENSNNETTSSHVSTSSVNSQSLNPNGVADTKNYAYYEKMRREDPKRYFSPRIQGEIIMQAEKMGTTFLK